MSEKKSMKPLRELIQTKNAPQAVGTYSQAVSAGGFLYTSGQIGINPASGKIEVSDTKSQCLQVMNNILAILEARNLSLVNIIKLTVYVKDLNDFGDINDTFKDFFGLRLDKLGAMYQLKREVSWHSCDMSAKCR